MNLLTNVRLQATARLRPTPLPGIRELLTCKRAIHSIQLQTESDELIAHDIANLKTHGRIDQPPQMPVDNTGAILNHDCGIGLLC